MAMSNGYVTNYQRVSPQWNVSCKEHAEVEGHRSKRRQVIPKWQLGGVICSWEAPRNEVSNCSDS